MTTTKQKFEPFIPNKNPNKPPTKKQVEIAYRWFIGEIRLRSALRAMGYAGVSSNGMRCLSNIFLRAVRDGIIEVRYA